MSDNLLKYLTKSNSVFNAQPHQTLTFVAGLQARHRAMLERRPEARPGELKTEVNFAGSTQFVLPGFVRGTLQEGSLLTVSVPEAWCVPFSMPSWFPRPSPATTAMADCHG